MCQDRAVAAPADTPQLAASRPHSRCIRALTAFDLRKLAGHRVSSWSGLGIWLAAARPARARNADQNADQSARPPRHIPAPVLIIMAALTGCAGGIYGIGGGAILSPILIGSGRPAAEVAPASLACTFVTSLGGVLTFTLLSVREGPVAPNWPTGIALGIGGIAAQFLKSGLS
jgi:uncharacterized membrane protein YfcA